MTTGLQLLFRSVVAVSFLCTLLFLNGLPTLPDIVILRQIIQNLDVFRTLNDSENSVHHTTHEQTSSKQLQHNTTSVENTVLQNTTNKIILWYIKTRYQPPMPGFEKLKHCPEMHCRMTSNRTYFERSSAVVFPAQLIRQKDPPLKLPGQVWIFHNHESPRNRWFSLPTFRQPQWKGKFNWTMDYRKESDILSPYGIVEKLPQPRERNYQKIVLRKKGMVAWMVSACHSEGKRELYVEKLKKRIPVKVFGECGGGKCGRYRDKSCLEKINKYKFYLAFENAFCPDYITEKFYHFYNIEVILVVRGGGNYSRYIPEGTYINTADFQSVDDLANYLEYLDKHDDEYIEYLKRKDNYRSVFEAYPMRNNHSEVYYIHYHYEHTPFCDVCQRLWNTEKYTKTYSDIGAWFDSGRCYTPPDMDQIV